MIRAGVVPYFVQFLQRADFPQLQFEASTGGLTNIASGTSENTGVVIDSGAVPIFVQLLRSPSDDVREQAVWALGNIAGDSPKCRDMVLARPLCSLAAQRGSKLTALAKRAWTLSNFCRGQAQPRQFEQLKDALPALARLVHSNDEEVLTDACWALSYPGGDERQDPTGVIDPAGSSPPSRLVEPSRRRAPSVLIRRAPVGNIVTGDDYQTQIIINCRALPSCWRYSLRITRSRSRRRHAGPSRTSPPATRIRSRP